MTNELKGKVNYSVNENIAILEVDNPPVNPLAAVLEQVYLNILPKLITMNQ